MSDPAKLLLLSGASAIAFSMLLGFVMLAQLQRWGRHLSKTVNLRQLVAAHLDWILLGLLQMAGAALVAGLSLLPSSAILWAIILGAWINPLAYLFRAFGINAFAFAGPPVQKIAATLGLGSSLAITYGWVALLIAACRV